MKPTVSILYSSSVNSASSQSCLLAQYFGGLLLVGKYSKVHLVSCDLKRLAISEFTVIEGQKNPVVVRESDDFMFNAPTSSLASANIIILCCNPTDTEACTKLLKETLPKKPSPEDAIGIFSLIYGALYASNAIVRH